VLTGERAGQRKKKKTSSEEPGRIALGAQSVLQGTLDLARRSIRRARGRIFGRLLSTTGAIYLENDSVTAPAGERTVRALRSKMQVTRRETSGICGSNELPPQNE